MPGGKMDISNPQTIRFLVEMYEREQILRDQWNTKNLDRIHDAAVLKRESKGYFDTDITRYIMEQGMKATTRDHESSAYHKYKKPLSDIQITKGIAELKHGYSIVDVGLGDPKKDPLLVRPDTDLSLDPIMRPVPAEVKKILYKAKPLKQQYLKERNKISPEEKYYFPECTSWDHGWRNGDSKVKPGYRHGKKAYVALNKAIVLQWAINGSASLLVLTGLAAFCRKIIRNKPRKPIIDFSDQSFVEPGLEKIHSSKLYSDRNENDLLHYFDEDTRTLYEAFRRGLKESNNGKCLGWREGGDKPYIWQSYEDTLSRAQNFGSGLLNLGLAPGQETLVGIYLKNCPEWVMVEQAAYCYSMIVVPLYDTSDAKSCSFVVQQTQMSVIVCEDDSKANILLEQLPPCVKKLISIKNVLQSTYEKAKSQGVVILTFNEVESLGASNTHICIPPKPDDLCTICYTSGTTGMPKGVMLTHANLIACICGVSVHLGDNKLTCNDVTLSFLPLSHMLERFFEQCIYIVGGSVGFFSGDVKNLTDDLRALKPTVMPAVPRLLNKMYDRIQSDIGQSKLKRMMFNMAMKAKQSELKKGIIRNNSIWDRLVFNEIRESTGGRLRYMFVSSAPLAGSILTFVRCALSCQVVESYGQTECTASMATTLWGEHVPDHVGPPIPCCKIKLVDVPEMGYYANKNQGEVCVKGANVFKGYYKDPEKTKETIDKDGWLYTGDVGQWLQNGTLKIIDRKKHIFKLSQGEYVAPEKIQNIYLRSQYVEQVFVYGESLKSCLIAIVVPVKDVITCWAADHGIYGSITELCQNKRVIEVIKDSMQQCGKAAGLRRFEQVKDICLHPEPFTLTNGLLTPTMKTKRPEIKDYFKQKLHNMYKNLD